MNALMTLTTVMLMEFATTPMGHFIVLVALDTLVTALIVKVGLVIILCSQYSMNCKSALTGQMGIIVQNLILLNLRSGGSSLPCN